jgi:ribokinase
MGRAFATSPGGKGANQAVAARRAGAEVVFVSAVGDDDLGRQALGGYRREGIDVSHVKTVPGVASGVALIYVAENGENMIGVAPGANHALAPDDIDDLPDSLFRAGDSLLVGLEIPRETAIRALERGKKAGMVVVLNPAPAPTGDRAQLRRLLASADVITPNRGEAATLAGDSEQAGSESDHAIRRLLELGPETVVVTLGAQGCLVAIRGGVQQMLSPPKVEAVDTVGAGDAFNGALAVALAEGRPPIEAARWACAAAALAVTRPGAQTGSPTRDEIDRLAARDS